MSTGTEYPKIPGPFKRATEGPDKGKVIWGAWSTPEIQTLRHEDWIWTEKIDGTNVRVIWDGYDRKIRGRTEGGQLHPDLIGRVSGTFPEDLLEQRFEKRHVVLYGEGFGPGIQAGGEKYDADKDFVLFDVRINDVWLPFDEVLDVSDEFEALHVPRIGGGDTMTVLDAIGLVRDGLKSVFATQHRMAEGMVGVPVNGYLDRRGNRISVKIKGRDLKEFAHEGGTTQATAQGAGQGGGEASQEEGEASGGAAQAPPVQPADTPNWRDPDTLFRYAVNVHPEGQCSGEYCVVHNPSEHLMRDWPMVWRSDKGVVERLCRHGVGHPDPDDAAHLRRVGKEAWTVHGCDLCCNPFRRPPDSREARGLAT